jgi:hypothetical protein
MSTSARSRILGLLSAFGSAVAAASASSQGHQPKARDLRALGIDPEQFRTIKHF